MGLRKLLSTNTTTPSTEEKKVNRKSSSSLSLSKSISNWAGKEKEKLKQHSLNSKRQSQPSPTHSNGSIQSHNNRKTNPFETNEPVTPTSGSLRDVNDVVSKRRTSDLSSSEDQQSWSEDNIHHQTIEEDNNSDEENDYVSSPMTYDSNKHEVKSVDIANDRKEQELLYAELETVALQLQTINPENAVEIKERIGNVNNLLLVAMERSQVLEDKIKRVMEQSKQIIEASVEENRELKENLKLQIENEENTHSVMLKELNEQRKKVQAEKELLEQEKHTLLQDNKMMEERYQTALKEFNQRGEQELKILEEREQELEMLKIREKELEMLKVREQEELKEEKVALIKDHEERYQMVLKELDKLKETKEALEKKEREMSLTKEKIYMLFNQEITNDDELINGIKTMMIRIEGLEQEAERKKEEANQREQEYNELLRQEKIKFEDGTAEIRDLLDKEHDRLVGQMKENEELKIKLTELKQQQQQQQQEEAEALLVESTATTANTNDNDNEIIHLKEIIKQLEKEKHDLQQTPEDMAQLHAKAQLGLIEYLEGEDDVMQAITKYKKELETNLKRI